MYSVIIVDYNSIEETLRYIDRCIDYIVEQEEINFIIVDNFPQSKSKDILQGLDLGILELEIWNGLEVLQLTYRNHLLRVIAANCNNGYAKGNNLGIKYSRERLCDKYVLITNNDIYFRDRISLSLLKEKIDDNSCVAVVGPRVTGKDGKQQSPYKKKGIGYTIFRNFFLYFIAKIFPIKIINYALDSKKENGQCYWVSGCFFLANSNRIEKVGDFDENTFLYAEEMILSERLKKKDFCMYYCNDVEVIHEGSHTINKNLKNMEAEETLFDSYIYYFEQYRKESKLIIRVAKWYFGFIKLLFGICQKLNRMTKKEKEY